MFTAKKRHVDFILPPNPEENKAPEKSDDEINAISYDNLALGPAATEEDVRSYSGGGVPGSPSSYYNMINGQQSTLTKTQLQDNEILVPFIPDGPIENSSSAQGYSNIQNNASSSEIIMLQRKIDELVDKIYLLERKIEILENHEI